MIIHDRDTYLDPMTMGPEGLEPDGVTNLPAKQLRTSPDSRAAESGASEAKTCDIDPDLALFIARWKHLPEAARAALAEDFD